MLVTSIPQFNRQHRKKPYESYYHSRPAANTEIQYYSKPLEVNTQTFKGFYNFKGDNKTSFTSSPILSTSVEKLSSSLSGFTKKTLGELGERHLKTYEEIIGNFVSEVKTNKDFRKVLKISDDWADSISTQNLPRIPKEGIVPKFLKVMISPITSLVNLYKPFFRSKFGESLSPKLHAKLNKEKEYEALIANYKSFLGLNDSVKIWENSYRQFSGNPHWNEGEDFLIPKDILLNNINSRRPQTVDPTKGKYSTKSLMLGNRLISGLIYAVYLSTDAYNTTMKYSGSEEESTRQRKSRFIQENARIGLNLYFQNVIFSMLEGPMNKSLATALLASGSTVALSEIIGRQLVSKPIMPSDKKTLDEMEERMAHKKGFFPALGRLMTRTKKTGAVQNQKAISANETTSMDVTAFKSNSANPFVNKNVILNSFQNRINERPCGPEISSGRRTTGNQPSFTGFDKTAQMFESKQLKNMLEFVKEFEPKQYEYYKNLIEKGLKSIKTVEGKDVSNLSLEKAMSELSQIPIGDTMTKQGKIAHSVGAPFYWGKSLVNYFKKMTKKLSPAAKTKEMTDIVKKHHEEFDKYLKDRLALPAWQKSKLSSTEKHDRILEEFINNKKSEGKQIQGVKNMLLWLDKQIKANKFDLSHMTEEQKKTLQASIQKSMLLADSAKHLEYDGNTLAQLNIHTARIITTIFLVTDAYNLTMQYSNDNKKEAQGSAKGRAIQEGSRISVSAYMLGFIHNLMSKVCNSGLAGAFLVTATTSIVNDTIARLLVGVPLTPQKSKAQNAKSKR